MHAHIRHLGGVRFEVEARDHRIVCDQPLENGGEDRGMTPPELLLASLGTCAGYYALQYLRTRSLATEGLAVRVSAEKENSPARLDRFRIEVETGELSTRHEEGLQRAVHSCLIHNTLLARPEITIEHRTTPTGLDLPVLLSEAL
jgi:putative redox protein